MARLFRSLFNDISLKNKVFLFNGLVIILSLFSLGFFATSIASGAIIDKAEKSSSRELELIDRNLDTMMRSYEDYIRVIATDYRLQDLLLKSTQSANQADATLKVQQIRSTLSDIMSNIVSPNTQVISTAVLSQSRQVLYYNAIYISRLGAVFGDDFLDKVIEQQTPVWTGLFLLEFNDRVNPENSIAVAKLVIDKNLGTKTGVVVLFISEKNISKIFPDQRKNSHDSYYIVDQSGSVISSVNKSNLNKPLDAVLGIRKDEYNTLMKQGRVITKQGNKDFLLSMQRSDKLGWQVVSSVSLEEITSENAKIQSVIVIGGIICLAFAFGVSYLISHTVTKPVHKLAGNMTAVRDGDMSIRADTEIHGELGILANGFNELMDKIQGLLQAVLSEQKTRREFEFMLIQSQIKPHFLYNSLETIISLNKLGRYDDAISIAKSLANFYRSSLSKGGDMIRIAEEVSMTSNYLAIQKMRYSNYMEYSINIQDEIKDLEIPKLTLQPLVENSIYHGLKLKDGVGRLEINGYLSESGDVCIEVYDDGAGIPEDKINVLLEKSMFNGKSEDFGLASVNNRIKLLYGTNYGIQIQSELGSFTKVTLTIPASKLKG